MTSPEDDERNALREVRAPLRVIPPNVSPDDRLPYSKPEQLPLRFQVSQVCGLSACTTCALGWVLQLVWAVSPGGVAGLGSFVMMMATGALVLIGDIAARPGARPKALIFAVLGTVGCLAFFVLIDFLRR